MKKLLFSLLAILMVSCSTVHKNISSVKKTEDSVSVVTKDTSSVSTQINHNDNFTAKGIDITVNYDSTKNGVNADSVKWTPVYVPKSNVPESDKDYDIQHQVVQYALSNLPSTGELPTSITIHIDSVTNDASSSVSKDSLTGNQKSVTNVKTNTLSKDRVVSKTGFSIWVYIGLGVAALIAIVVFALKIGIKL
jgi:hypothetical protein